LPHRRARRQPVLPAKVMIDCLVVDRAYVGRLARWSEYMPDGMLAELLSAPAETDTGEFEALQRSDGASGSSSRLFHGAYSIGTVDD
jgi:hypothetical protein